MPAAAGEKQRNEKSDLQGSVQGVAGSQNGIAGGLGGLADHQHLTGHLLGGFLQGGVGAGAHGKHDVVITPQRVGGAVRQRVVHTVGIELGHLGTEPQQHVVFLKVLEHVFPLI